MAPPPPPNKPIDEHELQAYHDGEMDAARRIEVDAWLTTHPDDAARLQAYRNIDRQLHQRFDPVLTEPQPNLTNPALATRPWHRGEWLPRLANAVGIAALMLASGLLGWSLHQHTIPPTGVHPTGLAQDTAGDLIRPALFAHQVYATDRRRPVEVPAIQRASLNQWVSQRMHTTLQAPNLASQGLSLIGGRLLPSSNRMAAQFMYQDDAGNRTTVYVRRISGGARSDFQYRESNALHAFYWFDQAMGYAVIGKQPAAHLIDVAAAVQHAFAGTNSGQAQKPRPAPSAQTGTEEL